MQSNWWLWPLRSGFMQVEFDCWYSARLWISSLTQMFGLVCRRYPCGLWFRLFGIVFRAHEFAL